MSDKPERKPPTEGTPPPILDNGDVPVIPGWRGNTVYDCGGITIRAGSLRNVRVEGNTCIRVEGDYVRIEGQDVTFDENGEMHVTNHEPEEGDRS